MQKEYISVGWSSIPRGPDANTHAKQGTQLQTTSHSISSVMHECMWKLAKPRHPSRSWAQADDGYPCIAA